MNIKKVSDYLWEIPKSEGMRVPARIYTTEDQLAIVEKDGSLGQARNVAHLPGIVKYSLAMPDIHFGYGFPIGGVAATDPAAGGVVSPGGVGYDINCGVRMIRTDLTADDVRPRIRDIVNEVFRNVPSGVGSSGGIRKLSRRELEEVMVRGTRWAVEHGYGTDDDTHRTEELGCMSGADPAAVSSKAVDRGMEQLGTLGSGNHFLEVDVVTQIFSDKAARAFGLELGTVVLQVHCGSRGLGHQICEDYLSVMQRAMQKYGLRLPDRQLACAPVESDEGRKYLAAMACAANFAWANRQCIMHLVLEAIGRVFKLDRKGLGAMLIYDVCHNIAKLELHNVDGQPKRLCVHRKGATRAFPAGHPQVPAVYREIGQPVLIPGDMGSCSYLLVGTEAAMEQTFGTTCHGAGRVLSRAAAIKRGGRRDLVEELAAAGVTVRAKGRETLAEEMPEAYKDVEKVVQVMHEAGISLKVAKLVPIGVTKG